jgi:tRNA(adenine34) deaminase
MMARCRELARRAREAGNSAVGSLVVLDGEIVSEAEEETPAGPVAFAHAELLAVQRAIRAVGRRRLPAATLYSTHEPCFLCSYAIRATGIERVVLERAVPEIGGATSNYPLLAADDVSFWGPPPTVVWLAFPGEV